MSCGEISMLEGGTIKGSSIINSQMVNSTIQNSTLDSAAVTNLASIDESSAKRIADAIAALTPEQLIPLIKALVAKQAVIPVPAPDTSDNSSVPTTLYGLRDIGMGAPDVWAQFDEEYAMPLYKRP